MDKARFTCSSVWIYLAPYKKKATTDECFDGAGVGGKGNCSSGRGMEQYRRVLRLEPDKDNPLLLRSYGKYLHKAEGDLAGAEEY